MHPDSLGFLYPVIDQKRCVDCGLCVKSCFNNHKPTFIEPLKTCVGHVLKVEEQVTSTVLPKYCDLCQRKGTTRNCNTRNARPTAI